MIGGHAEKESMMGGIMGFLRPAPMIDPFPANERTVSGWIWTNERSPLCLHCTADHVGVRPGRAETFVAHPGVRLGHRPGHREVQTNLEISSEIVIADASWL